MKSWKAALWHQKVVKEFAVNIFMMSFSVFVMKKYGDLGL